MSTLPHDTPILTLADLLARLGGVPLDRIRFVPHPGTAVEQDVLDLHDHEDRLFELVEGVLVEKPIGYMESRIAIVIARLLDTFCEDHELGIVTGADGMMRLSLGLVRMPDVSVVLWERLPERSVPEEAINSLAPDLAVEVLSKSNTPGEIDRKLREYFAAGCRCAWIIDPATRTGRVYSEPDNSIKLTADDLLTAETVLPGFSVSLSEVFRRARLKS